MITMHTLAGYDYAFAAGTEQAAITVLALHGTGGDEHDLIPLVRTVAPGAAIISPRGTVLEHGTTLRFFARRSMTDIDIDDLRVKAADLAAFVRAAIDAHDLDGTRVIAVGLSNGANIALQLLLHHPGTLDGAALMRTMLLDPPTDDPALAGTDILIDAGSADPFLSPGNRAKLVELLTRSGADVVEHVEPTGHGLAQGDIDAVRAWFTTLDQQ